MEFIGPPEGTKEYEEIYGYRYPPNYFKEQEKRRRENMIFFVLMLLALVLLLVGICLM